MLCPVRHRRLAQTAARAPHPRACPPYAPFSPRRAALQAELSRLNHALARLLPQYEARFGEPYEWGGPAPEHGGGAKLPHGPDGGVPYLAHMAADDVLQLERAQEVAHLRALATSPVTRRAASPGRAASPAGARLPRQSR